MKYKVGDIVTIRNDLKIDNLYHMMPSGVTGWAVPSMVELAGKKATVIKVDNIFGYSLNIDGANSEYEWVDEMFEVEKPKTSLKDSLLIDMDRMVVKLKALLETETSGSKRAVIKEIIDDMKINKKLL